MLLGCYSDDELVVESANTSHRSSEITSIIKSMSAHYGAFDDAVDATSCFSINFPYQLLLNQQPTSITSMQDLESIVADDEIQIVYPVQITFFNYEEHHIANSSALLLAKQNCDMDFNIRIFNCLQFAYPIQIKKYNDLTSNFDTYQLQNNKEVFLHFDNLHNNDLYEIDYPISVENINGQILQINSNAELTSAYFSSLETCN